MSETAEYQIDGKTYTQSFLTIEQAIKFFKCIKGIKIKDMSDIPGVLETLIKSGKLKALLEIVLQGDKPIDINKIKPAMLIKIVGDFFFYNDLLDLISTASDIMEIFNSSAEVQILMNQSQPKSKSQTGTDSSPSPPMETSDNTGTSEPK